MPRPKGAKGWDIVICANCGGEINRENARYLDGLPYGFVCYKRILLLKERSAQLNRQGLSISS